MWNSTMAVSAQEQGYRGSQDGTRHGTAKSLAMDDKPTRLTLSGAFLGIAITAGLFAMLFSPYWLILTGFATVGFTQSCGFDLSRIEQRERHRRR